MGTVFRNLTYREGESETFYGNYFDYYRDKLDVW